MGPVPFFPFFPLLLLFTASWLLVCRINGRLPVRHPSLLFFFSTLVLQTFRCLKWSEVETMYVHPCGSAVPEQHSCILLYSECCRHGSLFEFFFPCTTEFKKKSLWRTFYTLSANKAALSRQDKKHRRLSAPVFCQGWQFGETEKFGPDLKSRFNETSDPTGWDELQQFFLQQLHQVNAFLQVCPRWISAKSDMNIDADEDESSCFCLKCLKMQILLTPRVIFLFPLRINQLSFHLGLFWFFTNNPSEDQLEKNEQNRASDQCFRSDTHTHGCLSGSKWHQQQ